MFRASQSETSSVMDTSASSGEPSVNQATPEFHAVEQELKARQAVLREIHDEILQQNRADIIRRNPWMRNSMFLLPQDMIRSVESMVTSFELDSLSTPELEQFLQDIRANPSQLHSIFKEYWPGGK